MNDIMSLLDLINGYAAKGIMLPRTEFEMSENIRDFTVVFSGERLAAAAPCISTVPPSARSVRWRSTLIRKRTALDGACGGAGRGGTGI